MSRLAVADAGPLYAAADADDDDHAASIRALANPELHLVVPALVGPRRPTSWGSGSALPRKRRSCAGSPASPSSRPEPADFPRMAELVEQYADLPLGGTDASVIALAERLDAPVIVTLDERHFGAVRPRHRDAFELVP